MATAFKINTPVTTTTNFVDVQNDMPAGTHVFQLAVVDNQGNRSNPVQASVVVAITLTHGTVVPTPAPTPIT